MLLRLDITKKCLEKRFEVLKKLTQNRPIIKEIVEKENIDKNDSFTILERFSKKLNFYGNEMEEKDLRWQQRLENFEKALAGIKRDVRISEKYLLSEAEKEYYKSYSNIKDFAHEEIETIKDKKETLASIHTGLIKSFEITWELAWNVMKDYFKNQGIYSIRGPRDAIKEAFNKGLIEKNDSWSQSVRDRHKTTHIYEEEMIEEIIEEIKTKYICMFEQFARKMNSLKND